MFKLLMLAGVFFSIGAPASVTKVTDGYKLETCGLESGAKYTVTDQQNSSVRQGGRVDSSGCVKTTFRGEKLRPEDNLIIEINGKTVASEIVPGHPSTFMPEPNPGSHVKPDPMPGPRPEPSPDPMPGPRPEPVKPDPMPAPVMPNVDIYRVMQVANNQARMMANKVVEKYGASENARYNMWLGLNEGVRVYLQMASLYGDQFYKSGFSYGGSQGSIKGMEAGVSAAQITATAQAQAEVYGRFRSVVDSMQNPNLVMTVPPASYAGRSPDIAEPKTIEQRIREKNAEFYGPLSGYDFSERTPVGDLYGWGSYQFETVKSWYSATWAWTAWLNRSLGGGYESEISYYRRISDRNQTGNYQEADSAFRSEFRNVYNSVLVEKWNNAITRPNPAIYNLGMALGQGIGREYANDRGYVDGYRRSYTSSSLTGYGNTFPTTYSQSFQSSVSLHESQPVVGEFSAHLMDKVKGASFFLPLNPFDLSIDKAVNAGAKGVVPVSVSGGGVTPSPESKFITVEGLSSSKQVYVIQNIGMLPANVSPYAPTVIQVRVGQTVTTVQIQVYFDNVMRVLAATGQRRFVDYAKLYLASEYEKARNDYYKAGRQTLPEIIVRIYNESDAAGKARMAGYREELRSIFGSEPGFFNPGRRQAWRDAQAWVNLLR